MPVTSPREMPITEGAGMQEAQLKVADEGFLLKPLDPLFFEPVLFLVLQGFLDQFPDFAQRLVMRRSFVLNQHQEKFSRRGQFAQIGTGLKFELLNQIFLSRRGDRKSTRLNSSHSQIS